MGDVCMHFVEDNQKVKIQQWIFHFCLIQVIIRALLI